MEEDFAHRQVVGSKLPSVAKGISAINRRILVDQKLI
jgi:hypothetical protein